MDVHDRWIPSIKDFEAAIAELEAIVKKLEEGDLPLEQSLALYERGVQLSRFCHARLEEAERRIEILNERGELKPAPAVLAGDDAERGRGGGERTPTRSPRFSTRARARRSTHALDALSARAARLPAARRRGDALQRLRRRQAAAADPDARRGRRRRA